MARTSCIRFVLDQHAVGFLYSASSLKQQSAARHGHIILLPSQQVFNSLMWMDAEKQQIPILKSDLTRSELEPTIYRNRGEYASNYTSNVVFIT